VVPDVPRLVNLFILRRPVAAPPEEPRWAPRPWVPWVTRAVKLVIVIYIWWEPYHVMKQGMARYDLPKPPLYGAYVVEKHTLGGEERPIEMRWATATFTAYHTLSVWTMTGVPRRFQLNNDADAAGFDTPPLGHVDVAHPDDDHLQLSGDAAGQKFEVTLRRVHVENLTLISRGFHWVSEFPYNF
jgi:hypothetical protein